MRNIRSILALSLLFFINLSHAAWLKDVPQTITQPDGTIINCLATGDEFYNWMHDNEGYTIIQDHSTGFYTYAQLVDGKLVPTNNIVGKTDPIEAGLLPWINISAEAMKNIRAAFVENYMPEKKPIAGYDEPGSHRNIGTLNNLVVYIRFSDQIEFTKDTLEMWNMFNKQSTNYNSLYNYYQSVSYGQLEIPSTFYPLNIGTTVISYQDIYPRSYFMPYDATTNPNGYQNSDQKKEREHNMLKRAILDIADQVPENLELDYNNDGYVDNVAFIIRGNATAWSTLLWPHRWALYSEYVYIHGKRVYDYNFQIEERLGITGVGVLCHEMFHSLGAPDLYHYTTSAIDPVDEWDIMGVTSDPPRSMGAYMKYRYGNWIEEIPEITECGTYMLNPVSSPGNNCYKIASPNSGSEYFVLEYRKKEGTFEGLLPNSGLLIYRINTAEDGNGNSQGPPDELYVYRPNGTLTVNGNINNATFAEDYARTEFNDNTNPTCFLSNGNPGGLDIFNVGFIGETISFEVNFEKEPLADFSASQILITENCSVDFTDRSVCEVDSWQWTFEGGTPGTSNEQFPTGISYESEGLYDVNLTVSNQFGQNSISFPDFITVSTTALPVANFIADDTVVCTGAVVEFTDLSEVCPVSWQWEIIPNSGIAFINGTSAASQNPEVVFNEPAYYSIKLTIENANGADEFIRDEYVKAGGIQISGAWSESFEFADLSENGWSVLNPDDNITWGIYDVAGLPNGTKAAGINLFNYNLFNRRDQLISPILNIPGLGASWVLAFKHAYTTTNPNHSDSLIVKISHDCGETWTRVLTLAEDGSTNFITRPNVNSNFIPSETDDWCGVGFGAACSAIDLSDFDNQPNTMIMFESVTIIGNNLFIDDINLDILENVAEKAGEESISVFPNPSSGIFTISPNVNIDFVNASIYNQHGQKIKYLAFDQLLAGEGLNLDLSHFDSGIYFLHLSGDGYSSSIKLVVN